MIALPSTKVISIDELWRFFNQSTSLLCIAGTDGYLKYTNPSFTRLLGYSEEELLSKKFTEFVHPGDRELILEKITSLRHGSTISFTNRCETLTGSIKWFDWSITFNDGMIYATAHDCTDKHEIEIRLVQEKLNTKKSIAEATLIGQEMEKNEIGKELHDNINQMLTTVKLYHEMALARKEMNTDLLKKGSSILIAAIEEIRGLSKSLVAPGEDGFCFDESVDELIFRVMESRKINILFTNTYRFKQGDGKFKLTIFRIIQEQLNNIIKHADASTVHIELKKEGEYINLEIADDGKGFDPSQKKKGIGLNNIISRAKLYNGKVDISAATGKGCRLTVNIPLLSE